jgi:hypothetical protein
VTPDRSATLLNAVRRAALVLGIEGVFLRLVAVELLENSWLVDLALTDDGDTVIAGVRHACDQGCDGVTTVCLTACAIEHTVGTTRSRPYAIESRHLLEDRLELCLHPVR